MKLTARHRPDAPAPPAGRRRLRFALGALLLVAYSVAVFAVGVGYYKALLPILRNLTRANTAANALPALARSPLNFLSARLDPPEVEQIELDIRFKHLHRLNEKRNEALRLGTLVKTGDDFVPAELRHGAKKVAVKLRLKGDQPDHWRGEKRSYRVHVRGGDHLFGMRRFSIQAPATRGYHLEPLFHAHMRREGVLAPRYAFLDVTVNGKDIGLMALEEHVSKELLESQQRRDGVVFRFDEGLFWQHVILTNQPGPYARIETSFLRPFESGRIAESPALTAQWETAAGLMRGFMAGNLSAAEVFDLELMARFMAVAEVWRAPHALTWLNRRFYFNPLSARIEPIAFDANIQSQYKGPGLTNLGIDFSRRLLADPEFAAVFARELRRISGEMADGTLQAALEPRMQEWLRIAWRETPALAPLEFSDFAELAKPKQAVTAENLAHFDPELGQPDLRLPSPVIGHLQHSPDGPFLELTNALPIEVTIEALRFPDAAGGAGAPVTLHEPNALPLRLAPSAANRPPTQTRLAYAPPAAGGDAIEGSVRVRGQDEGYRFVARSHPLPATRAARPDFDLDELLAAHSFLSSVPGSPEIRVRPGDWPVNRSLRIPAGYRLVIGPGTTLRFGSDAGILSRGALRFEGSAAEPVLLTGSGDALWPGVFVIESAEPSTWSHVEVRNTAGFDALDSGLTGGVTFRRNEVSLRACRFLDNQAEDALNIIRSEFSLVDVDIRGARSDALDADFTRGTIRGGTIAQIGGDGIDMSGSTITIERVALEDIHDKAVSVGEASDAVVREVEVRRVGTLIASKDGSRTDLSNSVADSVSEVAFMAYTKKPVYGGAELFISGVSLGESGQVALAQIGSRVVIDGSEVANQELDTEELYRQGSMRK